MFRLVYIFKGVVVHQVANNTEQLTTLDVGLFPKFNILDH